MFVAKAEAAKAKALKQMPSAKLDTYNNAQWRILISPTLRCVIGIKIEPGSCVEKPKAEGV